MKYFILLFLTVSFSSHAIASCNVAKKARQMVKAIVAIDDIVGINSYYGSVEQASKGISKVHVQPHFEDSKSWYSVLVKDSNCAVQEVKLIGENLLADCNALVCK